MPDGYENPDVKPCTGMYSWVPAVPPNFGGVNATYGFQNLIIDRGAFRNYYVTKRGSSNIKVITFDNKTEGNKFNPIINATRPLSLNFPVKQSNNNNYVVYGPGATTLVDFEFVDYSSSRLSCVEITYDLSMYYEDPSLDNYNIEGDAAKQNALEALKNGDVSENNITTFITDLQPGTIKVYGLNSSGEVEIGSLNLTRIRSNPDESNLVTASSATSSANGPFFATTKLKTANNELDRNAYPRFTGIRLKINPDVASNTTSLVLVLKKIMFFTADRVNFRTRDKQKQLPCNALGYSMNFNGKYFPQIAYASFFGSIGGFLGGTGTVDVSSFFIWPQDNRVNGCNVHIKLFNPDFNTGSPGFAHSLNLHIYILDFPIFFQPGFILPHFAVIIGPTAFTQQLLFYGNSARVVRSSTNLANMMTPRFKKNNGLLVLEDRGALTNITRNIYPFFDYLAVVKQQQFYYEQELPALENNQAHSFRNFYYELDGIVSNSGVYQGSIPRRNYFLNANEAVSTSVNQARERKAITYSTYVTLVNPTLFEIFTKSDPCLTFKCAASDGITTGVFQEPGFMAAAINCFVRSPSGLLDTKLVYRIYAVARGAQNFDPNSIDALNNTVKIVNSGQENSYIEVTQFDDSWDFSNVLVTGNIESVLQNIEIEQMMNNDGRTKLTPMPIYNGKVFDLYCAVYAFSVVNDSYAQYNVDDFSSLDYPMVTFSIQNDFVLTLPLYYRKSLVNGGTIQAIRDFGNYGKYTPDTSEYVIVTTQYNGQIYDTSLPYENALSDLIGADLLMTMIDSRDIDGQSTEFFIEPDENRESVTNYILLTDATSRARVAPGNWQIRFDLKTESTASLKFEIDLIDRRSYKLIMKLLSSQLTEISSSQNTSAVSIEVPFYLPPGENLLLLKIFVKNLDDIITFDKITLLRGQNTLQYFSYTTKQALAAPNNFYEDLPVQPSAFVGNCSEFILKFNTITVGIIYNLSDGLYIDGCIYSPTWVVDLPENMELDYRGIINGSLFPRATGIQPYQIFFRTGLSNEVVTLDTQIHDPTGLYVTLANVKTNTSNNAINQYITESYLRYFRYKTLATTVKANLNLMELDLSNPVMSRSEELLIQGRTDDTFDRNTVVVNLESPGYFSLQPSTEGLIAPLDQRVKNYMAQYNQLTCFQYFDSKIYSVGVTPNGSLVYSESPANTIANQIAFSLIETDNPLSANNVSEQIPQPADGNVVCGLAKNAFPGFLMKGNKGLIFYVFKSVNSSFSGVIKPNIAIYCRIINAYQVSNPIKFFDFGNYASALGVPLPSSFSGISQITVCRAAIAGPINSPDFYLAFTASNKIFVIQGVFDDEIVFSANLAIVFGNLNESGIDKEFVKLLNAMIASSYLYRMRYEISDFNVGLYNTDLATEQRVGFIDYDGIYLGVQFLIGNQIAEVVFDKSYAIIGGLRSIGVL